jgi:hypothetical protein
MHRFFSRIRCCGDMITVPLSSNGRLALTPLLRLAGVTSQYEARQTYYRTLREDRKYHGQN